MEKMKILKRIIFAAILAGCLINLAKAQTMKVPDDLNTKVSGKTSVTYIDLLRKVFPDAQPHKVLSGYWQATVNQKLRNLFDERTTQIFPHPILPEVKLIVEQKLETRNQGNKVLWLIITVTGKSVENQEHEYYEYVMAAYHVSEKSADLIDAAYVNTNDHGGFADGGHVSPRGKIAVAPGYEAVIVYNWTQVSLGENAFSLVDLGEHGFRVMLKEFGLVYDTRCGSNFVESARVRTLKTSVGGYRNLEVMVTLERSYENENGDGVVLEWRKYFRYVFAWQPGKQIYKAIINRDKQRVALAKKHNSCGDQ